MLKLVHLAPDSFIALLDKLLAVLEKKLSDLQKIEGGNFDKKKLVELCNNIKRLFDELKKVPEIDENAKFTEMNVLVRNLLEKHKNN